MKPYKCKICGYIYDPEKGESSSNITPKTPFDKLPDSYTCPLCQAPKSQFEEVTS